MSEESSSLAGLDLEGLSPSAKFVAYVLYHSDDALTASEIADE